MAHLPLRSLEISANADAAYDEWLGDVRPYHVNVGIPAKSVRVKSIAPPEALGEPIRREPGE